MKSTPSLLVLLGVVAFAGYQNRDQISAMVDVTQKRHPGDPTRAQPRFLTGLGDLVRSGGGTLSAGLGDLVNRFPSADYNRTARSTLTAGQNSNLQGADFVHAIGEETLGELVYKTDLSRAELVRRLTVAMPEVVNKLTSDARLPTEAQAMNLL